MVLPHELASILGRGDEHAGSSQFLGNMLNVLQ